jgi:putative endonuclease
MNAIIRKAKPHDAPSIVKAEQEIAKESGFLCSQPIVMVSVEKWVVYMIQSESGKLYTGITKDLKRRLEEHKKKQKSARFFHFSPASKVVFQEIHKNRSEATKREIQIKKMSRQEKISLAKDVL